MATYGWPRDLSTSWDSVCGHSSKGALRIGTLQGKNPSKMIPTTWLTEFSVDSVSEQIQHLHIIVKVLLKKESDGEYGGED